jgi:hypothetical protein
MTGAPAERMLHLPVRIGDIELGRAVDLIVDPADGRTLGFEVLCRDGSHRYLPLAAAIGHPDWIEIASPLHLLDLDERSFYRRQAATRRSLRGPQK